MSSSFTIREHTFPAPDQPAGLYCVATPIGNLGDITIRALEVLAGCDVIACEDTRTTGVLLKRYGIGRPKISYNEHNANSRGPELLRRIAEGEAVALVSDAGTPLVSDPGSRLVSEAVTQNLPVIPLPGASAPMAALVGSALPTDGFRFCGFLPSKAAARKSRIQELCHADATLLFFESPARLLGTLKVMADIFGADRLAVVAREMTKMHETFYRGTLAELLDELEALDRIRGEIVIVVKAGEAAQIEAKDIDAMLIQALTTMKTKDAVRHVAERTGVSRQALYRQALDRAKSDE
ncbi:MAG: 16S rRNA (cytidine(1402)-2'-O)-methyltransferase [Rhizobiaceae bacterium]